jgi:ABC-type antimicrobial peptide transport system permease subunit
MAQTSSGSLVSSGGALLGTVVGAFTTILLSVTTYTLQLELTGTRIAIFLLVGVVVAAASALYVTRAD